MGLGGFDNSLDLETSIEASFIHFSMRCRRLSVDILAA